MDPVSAAQHFMLRRARDDPKGIATQLKQLLPILRVLTNPSTP
jgi:hypothetical protein